MGKKGKRSAKLNMTDEERLLYEEQKRVGEEEEKKKKEDFLINFLKEKMAKEEAATKANLYKLNHQWRNILREAKSKELKKDIEILSQTFERVVDRKDAVIKSLSKDLLEAEEQYSTALRSHIQNIDHLTDVQKQRLETMNEEHNTAVDSHKQEFDKEKCNVVDQHLKEMNDVADIIFAMEHNFEDKETDAKADFQSLMDEIKNKNLEEKHALRVVLETKVDDLWQQFKQALQSYTETTEERKVAFETLKVKDEKSAREIETQMRKLQRISDQIASLKGKMGANSKESEERNKQLREEREKMLALFQDLKSQMNKLRDAEREKLTKLTLESNSAIKELKRQKEKGEQIIKTAEMCRKLETEEEKVLPFYGSSLTPDEEEDLDAAVMEAPNERLALIMHEYSSLENFWKRHNKVLLDKLSLDKEKQTLTQENQQLRTLLKQYLDGISVNDEILSQVNPLFIVNNKTNVKLNVPVMDPRVRRPAQTVVEAAHVVQQLRH